MLDQTFDDAALVGRPLTIGNLVTTTSVGFIFTTEANTYTPYIEVGDEALDNSSQSEAAFGTPYQEVLTSFPLGSQVLTGLFLNETLAAPEQTTQTFNETLYDRIGYAARQGLAPVNVAVNPNGQPSLSTFDAYTLNVSAASQSPAAAQLAQENAVAAGTAVSAVANPSVVSQTTALIASARSALANFTLASDRETANLARGYSLAAYFNLPRLTMYSTSVVTSSNLSILQFNFDLIRDTIRAIASEGQNVQATLGLAAVRGLFDSYLEAQMVPVPPGGVNLSSAYLIQQSIAQGIPLVTIGMSNLSVLQTLDLPADAVAQITTEVLNGNRIIVPARALTINGQVMTAWFVGNPTTGEVLTQGQDGQYQGLSTLAAATLIVNVIVSAAESVFVAELANMTGNPALKTNLVKAGVIGAVTGLIGNLIVSFILNLAIFYVTSPLGPLSKFDPEVAPLLVGLDVPYPNTPGSTASGEVTGPANVAAGQSSGTVQASSATVSGSLIASWSSSTTNRFGASSLDAPAATIVDSHGNAVGSGSTTLSSQSTTPLTISGQAHYSLDGQGNLSSYGPAGSSLGVSGNWTSYSGSVTDSAAGGGDVTITLTTDGLALNGVTLPAGTYTITTAAATFSGSGTTSSPTFSGSVSITATNGTINLGPGSGTLSVGGKPLDPTDETTLDGYSGTITVSANGDGTDSVSLSGNAGDVLQVTTTRATLTTDQNAPVTFAANVQTSLADTYNLTADAPPGWTVSIDSRGNVTATPSPGLQGGTYPIQIIAQSQPDSSLEAQTTVDVMITPTQPGINFTVATDPLFTVPFNGAQLPSAFRATIQNLGPAADTYKLSFSNVPSGFSIVDSGTSVTVPAGATGIDGIYLVPNTGQPIPAPGTQVSFTVTATSTTDSSITKTQTETFTVPEIDAVSLTSTPTSLSSSPGVAASTTLTIQNDGNVPETVTLTATTPSGVTASSLAPITIAVGATQTETLTLTPDAASPLNRTLATTITASFGPSSAPVTTTDTLDLLVQSAQAAAVSQASIAAGAANNSQLASVLTDLSDTLASLQTATSAALFAEAQNDLTNLNTLLNADPSLTSLAAQLQPIITAANADDLTGMLSGSTSLFSSITGVLNQEAGEQFTASLSPTGVDLQPGQGQTLTLTLTNTASDSETLSLSTGTLPSGVTVQLGQSQVNLAADASTMVPVALSQTIQSTKIFKLDVTANAGVVQQSASAVVAIRPAAADVVSVTATPQAVNAGDAVTVGAQVFNTANATRNLLAQLQLLDQSNNVVATEPNVAVQLNPGDQAIAVALGQINTTGLADGLYNLQVSLLTSDGSPLPGNSAETPLLIGIPITATATASSSLLAPGTSTVTMTIQAQNATNVNNGGSSGQSFVLYFTQYTGAVGKVTLTYNGSTFSAAPYTTVASSIPADGLIFLPDGELLTANGQVTQVNPITGQTTSVSGGAGADHLALDPSGQEVWTSGQPGPLEEIPLDPFSNAIEHPLQGDDTNITAIAFDSAGNAYYTASSPNGPGDFGLIDLKTFTTTRIFSDLPAAHGISYDPFTGDLILYGTDHVTQIDPSTLKIVSDYTFTTFGVSFDQGAVDGEGHVYVADNGGHLLFIDYSKTGLVGDPSNYVAAPYLANALDDVAPLSGLGAITALLEVQHFLPTSGYTVDSSSITPTPGTTSPSEIDWLGGLLSGSSSTQEFQLTGQVTDMAPGQTRQISTGTSLNVQFTSGSGQQLQATLTLPPVTVAAEHIISLTPPNQSVDRHAEASFTVTLTNPYSTDVTYDLTTEGLDGFTVGLASSITVPAGQTVTTPLTVTVPLGAVADTTGFEVLASTTGGVSDSVEGELTVLADVALQARAVSLGISPTQATAGQGTSAQYVLTVSNVGSAEDTYSLSTTGLPSGVTATFGETSIDVPPGVSNFRDVPLTVDVPKGTTPGRYPFTVTATSTTDPTVTSTADGTLTVTAGGVQVTLNPGSARLAAASRRR